MKKLFAAAAILVALLALPAWGSGIGKIDAVVRQILEDLGITSSGVYSPAAASSGFTISFPPSAGVASISSTTYPAYISLGTSGAPALEFDGQTMEAIEFWNWTLPDAYDSTADLTVEIVILCDSSTSEATTWDVRFGTIEGEDLDSTAPGSILDSAVAASGTTSSTQGTATTIQWTLSNGQIDGAAAGDLMVFQLYRDPDDVSTADVQVLAIRCYQ